MAIFNLGDGNDGTSLNPIQGLKPPTLCLATVERIFEWQWGNDLIYGANDKGDFSSLESSPDHLRGGSGDDSLYGSSGEDDLDGGIGNDNLYGGNDNDRLSGDSGSDRLDGGFGNDSLDGGFGNDFLLGDSGDDTLTSIDGDILLGGRGNDTYFVANFPAVVVENSFDEGFDVVNSSVSFTLGTDVAVETLVLTGSDAINGTGNNLDNELFGNQNSNILKGEGGKDKLVGNGGSDTLDGGDGDDEYVIFDLGSTIVENSNTGGIDIVTSFIDYKLGANLENLQLLGLRGTGNALDNTIGGHEASNILKGEGGVDNLLGREGDDILVGGFGNDVLTGGVGSINNDKFVFDTGAAFNKSTIGIDKITDFTRGADKIALDKTTFTALSSFSFASVGTLAQAQTSSSRITYIQSLGSLFYNQNGASSGFGTGGQFADLTDGLVLAAADFLVQT